MTPLPSHPAPSARAPRLPPRARGRALAAALALATTLPTGACTSVGGALGFGASDPAASVEIRNTAGIGVNMYVVSRSGTGEVFLGQVGPHASQRIRIPRAAAGDRVWLRAAPIDGRPAYVREDIVLGRTAVWQLP